MAIKKVKPTPPRAPREIVVDVAAQALRVMDGPVIAAEFPVSTSRFGLGFTEGSFCTPTGHFVVREKIGAGVPPWTVFRARLDTGETAAPGGEEDLVLTRILTLDGLDPANTNTLERFVYIHGTNQENLIGTPASHGCIRLRNDDMVALHDMIGAGTPVRIMAPRASSIPDRHC
ncbi:MAG: L,D-transpeptidase [Chthoniobacterales bacterium]